MPLSDHFDGQRFFNPGQASTDRSVAELLRWRLSGTRAAWTPAPPVVAAKPARHEDRLTVTMVGHASVLIQVAGRNILVDPVWSRRASPFRFAGPKRATAPGIDFADLPPIDTVLLSHNHYDHMDAATLRLLHAAHRPRILTPLGNDRILARIIPGARVEVGDWGARFDLDGTVSITLHPAHHWSARSPRDRRTALWCGFVLGTPQGPVYVAGDTAYGDGAIFHQVRQRFGPPLLAVLPIGAYEPRWFMRQQHCNPDEAVRILNDCGAGHALGVHWGTFQLTDEPREAPAAALQAACRDHGLAPGRFVALQPGDVWRAPSAPAAATPA